MMWHMVSLTYLTALSLSTVTGITVTTSLIMLSGIAIIYTMLGGMKAVIWTRVENDCRENVPKIKILVQGC